MKNQGLEHRKFLHLADDGQTGSYLGQIDVDNGDYHSVSKARFAGFDGNGLLHGRDNPHPTRYETGDRACGWVNSF